MTTTVRQLGPDDAEAARRLGWEAFGFPATPPEAPAVLDTPGMTWFGAFDSGSDPDPGSTSGRAGGEGRLVGRTVDRAFDTAWGGAWLATCGVAGVTVAAEARGRGVLSPLFTAMLASARERGALVSTLFPTAPGIYRRFGYESVTELVDAEVATTALAGVRVPTATTTRRAVPADAEAIRRVYQSWAIAQNGPLSRRGVSFPASDEELLADHDGVSLALGPDGEVVGYVAWDRGRGYDENAQMTVTDLLATTAEGYQALLRLVGSFVSVAGTVRFLSSGDDLVRLQVPSLPWRVGHARPYMLKLLDVVGALTARRYPRSVTADLRFTLAGDFLADLDGGYRLEVHDGRATCVRTEPAGRVLTSRGLALMFAGTQSCANLRAAGQLSGGEIDQDVDVDALFGGPQTHVRDYF